jgi:hypothetical protein
MSDDTHVLPPLGVSSKLLTLRFIDSPLAFELPGGGRGYQHDEAAVLLIPY